MSDQEQQDHESDEARGTAEAPGSYGSLSVEDDPDGTENASDLAGTADPGDDDGPGPSVSEADDR